MDQIQQTNSIEKFYMFANLQESLCNWKMLLVVNLFVVDAAAMEEA